MVRSKYFFFSGCFHRSFNNVPFKSSNYLSTRAFFFYITTNLIFFLWTVRYIYLSENVFHPRNEIISNNETITRKIWFFFFIPSKICFNHTRIFISRTIYFSSSFELYIFQLLLLIRNIRHRVRKISTQYYYFVKKYFSKWKYFTK